MFKNKNLFVIAIIAVVNALGYGIIIPIVYSYSQKFGMTDFQNGLLFSAFSIAQFIATPIIGRMSDKYGRRPLLIASIAGTAISFIMMAFAPNMMWLFIARILDGITAGNIPVAAAVISDTTKPEERAKGFGVIGASFGFGFTFGPAISALTLPLGDAVPFLIAAAISIVAAVLTYVLLPETNTHLGEVKKGKLFDFAHLVHVLFDKAIGLTLMIALFYFLSVSLFIYTFQPFSLKIMGLTTQQISVVFTLWGAVGLVAQMFIIPRFTKKYGEKRLLTVALLVASLMYLASFVNRNILIFGVITVITSTANAFVMPLTQALLSKEVDAKSQGSIMGVFSSYQSIGNIFGPILAGLVASYSIPMPFVAGAVIIGICVWLSTRLLVKPHSPQHAF